jgi:hypothetical protein
MSVSLEVFRDGLTGGIQLQIGDERTGYRLGGPKFNGSGERLLRVAITPQVATELRRWLDKVDTPAAAPTPGEDDGS